MKTPTFKSEADLAKHVVRYLQDQHWDVYQEVQLSTYGRVADIVAVQGQLVWVVECKLTFGSDVVDQARWWTHEAHYSSVAVPWSPHRNGLLRWCCQYFGIGVLSVRKDGWTSDDESPRLNRKAHADRFREGLREQHKTYAEAGNSWCRHWTPFQQTCRGLAIIVAANPGIKLKDAICKLDHHYATDQTARSSLRHWIETGKVKDVRLEMQSGKIHLYPAGDGERRTA